MIAQIFNDQVHSSSLLRIRQAALGVTSKVRTLILNATSFILAKDPSVLNTECGYTFLHYEVHLTQLFVIVDQADWDISERMTDLMIISFFLCCTVILHKTSIFSAACKCVAFCFVDCIQMGPKPPPSQTKFVAFRINVRTWEVTHYQPLFFWKRTKHNPTHKQ